MQATRYKLHVDQVAIIMDAAQRMAYDRNCEAFLVWNQTLTPQVTLAFQSGTYIIPGIADVGGTVLGGTSGARGTLIENDDTAFEWRVATTESFQDGEPITIIGKIGAGTLLTTDAIETYLGPYDAPTGAAPPVRKIWGIITDTDARILGLDDSNDFPMDDFDFSRVYSPNRLFQTGRVDNVAMQFTFAQKPTLTAPYRWVYWRNPPRISKDDAVDDDTVIGMPATYHMNLVNASIKLAQLNLSGEDVDPKVIAAIFQPWWDTLGTPYTPMGRNSNQTLNKRGPSHSLI